MKSTLMVSGNERFCDVCAEAIPTGSAYRCGYTTPDAVAQWFDDPRFLPTFTEEPDGIVRLDVCESCAGESERILACSQPAVDPH